MSEAKEFFGQFNAGMGRAKEMAPNAVNGFGGLFAKVMGEGTLSVKQKELIALGIGMALQCEPCIRLHVKKCVEAGASREEIMEAASVAVMMAGGPAYTHLPMAAETLDAVLEG